MRPALVTGGCGFIGSHFSLYLLETHAQAHVTNLEPPSYAATLANLTDVADDPRYRFIHADVADRATVRRVVNDGVSAIINFAAESHVDRSIHDSGPFVRT